MHWFLIALLVDVGKPLVWDLCQAIVSLSLISYLSVSLSSLLMIAVFFSQFARVFDFTGTRRFEILQLLTHLGLLNMLLTFLRIGVQLNYQLGGWNDTQMKQFFNGLHRWRIFLKLMWTQLLMFKEPIQVLVQLHGDQFVAAPLFLSHTLLLLRLLRWCAYERLFHG